MQHDWYALSHAEAGVGGREVWRVPPTTSDVGIVTQGQGLQITTCHTSMVRCNARQFARCVTRGVCCLHHAVMGQAVPSSFVLGLRVCGQRAGVRARARISGGGAKVLEIDSFPGNASSGYTRRRRGTIPLKAG